MAYHVRIKERISPRTEPLIFNIQRFCTHDGPGIRTVVFIKGCPLRCQWCSNPESQNTEPNILFNERKCIGCGLCTEHCPQSIPPGRQGVDPGCTMCGGCTAACPSRALEFDGREYTIDDIVTEAVKDEGYYGSQGGVTISGGEPLLFPGFVTMLGDAVKRCGYHLALETTGLCDWETADGVFSRMDLLLYDIKHMDDEKHRLYTGVSNRVILENARKAAEKGYNIIVRIPLIGRVNDDVDNMERTADFCSRIGVRKVEFLPYHQFGESKYAMLHREYAFEAEKPSLEKRLELARYFQNNGIEIIIGD